MDLAPHHVHAPDIEWPGRRPRMGLWRRLGRWLHFGHRHRRGSRCGLRFGHRLWSGFRCWLHLGLRLWREFRCGFRCGLRFGHRLWRGFGCWLRFGHRLWRGFGCWLRFGHRLRRGFRRWRRSGVGLPCPYRHIGSHEDRRLRRFSSPRRPWILTVVPTHGRRRRHLNGLILRPRQRRQLSSKCHNGSIRRRPR